MHFLKRSLNFAKFAALYKFGFQITHAILTYNHSLWHVYMLLACSKIPYALTNC